MAASSKIQKTKSSKNLNGNTASTRTRDVIVRSSGKFTGIPKQPKSQKAPQSQTRTRTRSRTRSRSQTNSNGKLQFTTVKNTEPIKFKKEPVELTSNSKKLTGNPLFQALSPETTNKTKNNSSSLSHNPLFQALKSDSNTKKDVKLSSNPLFKVLSSSTSKVTKSNSNNKNSKNLIEKKSSTSKSSALEKLLKSGSGNKGKDSITDALRNTKNKKPLNPLEQALKGKFSGNNSRSKKPNDGKDRDRNNNRNNNKNNNRNSDNNNNNRNDNRNNDRNNNRNGSSNRNSRSNRTNNNNNNNNNNNINNFDNNNNNISNGFTSGSADLSFVNAADIRFLRIRNLKPGVNEGDVIIVMSQIGPVRKILLKESSKSTVAEVFFQNDTDTVVAYTKLNNKSADGRTLKCEIDNKSTIIQDKDYWNHFVASLSHQRGL